MMLLDILIKLFIFSLFNSNLLACADVASEWIAEFDEDSSEVQMGVSTKFNLTISNLNKTDFTEMHAVSTNSDIFEVSNTILMPEFDEDEKWRVRFTVLPKYLGQAEVFVEIHQGEHKDRSMESMNITVKRKPIVLYPWIHEIIFSPYFVIIFHLVLFGTFGMALNVKKVKDSFNKPIGIALDFLICFLILPVSTFILSSLLYHEDNIESQINLISLGFLSMSKIVLANCWTTIVRGNRHLSISITFINIFSSCILASTCLFVGEKVFQIGYNSYHYVAFHRNVQFCINPLAIGLSIQYFFPKIRIYATFLLKWIIAPCTIIGHLSSIIMLDWDLYLYRLIPINSILIALLMTFGANIVAWLLALLFRLDLKDCSAIAVNAVFYMSSLSVILCDELGEGNGELFDFLYIPVILSMPIVLLTNFVWTLFGKQIACYRRINSGHCELTAINEITEENSYQ